MTIIEAIAKIPNGVMTQPEGAQVSDAWRSGQLNEANALFVIAGLLHELNSRPPCAVCN